MIFLHWVNQKMIKLNLERIKKASPLFYGITDTTLQSCLEGVMGEVYGDSKTPKTAIAILGYVYIGGELDIELLKDFFNFMDGKSFVVVTENEEIRSVIINHYGKRCHIQRRFETVKEFPKLPEYEYSLPDGFVIKQFDEDLYFQSQQESWSIEFCENFQSCKDFLENGLGFGITYNGSLICGVTSFSYYSKGYEVIIATKYDYRKMGLAKIAAHKFIKASINLNKIPSWDAAHEVSLHLAEWLGYRLDYEYIGLKII